MPALRLKTKLVCAITLMVVAIVAVLATLYISEVVQQRIQEASDVSHNVGLELFSVARGAFQVDLSSSKVDLNDPKQADAGWQGVLEADWVVTALLGSALGDSRLIYDAAITDTKGQTILHTNPALLGRQVARREDFDSVVHAGIRKQLRVIYGPPQVYDVRVPLARDGLAFGEVRVGVSTVFLKNEIQPLLKKALELSDGAIFMSLILAAGLSNFALRPLAAISRRLDLISSGQAELTEAPSQRSDEYGTVSTKIERLGRQMRAVIEVFSALQGNLDQMMANLQDGEDFFNVAHLPAQALNLGG